MSHWHKSAQTDATVRSREAQIAELKLAVQEGEERLVKEREAVRKARDTQYQAQRKMEEVEEMMPRLQVEYSIRAHIYS